MKLPYIKISILCILFLFSLIQASAWFGFSLPSKNDHEELTNLSLTIIENNDTLDRYNELISFSDKIKSATGNLDIKENLLTKPKNKLNYINFNSAHFYHPNGSSLNNQWPSALNESYDWLEEAISAYSKNNKKEAFTKLGYMLHLIQDVAVPAHSHLIGHSNSPFDYLEFKADADDINTTGLSPVKVYSLKGNDFYAIERQFNELARKSYNESGNQSVINTYYGEGSYIGNNQPCGFPLIGQTCSPNITTNDITTLQNDLMPKAVQYSAGLAMRIYDVFKSLDWPTYHHDNQRTGFTLLKGDINATNTKNDINYVLQNTNDSALARFVIGDIDNNGKMDIAVSSSVESQNSHLFVVEKDKQTWFNRNPKTKQKWKVPINETLSVSPTLADTDNDEKLEVVISLDNGTLLLLDDNKQKWSYTVPGKFSSLLGRDVQGTLSFNAVSDLDNDGKKEIIFMDGHFNDDTWPADLYILRDNGNSYEFVTSISAGSQGGGLAAPSLADIDGDNKEEIVLATYYGIRVYDFDSGTTLTQKCSNGDRKIDGAPILYDIDRDNQYEIIYNTHDCSCLLGGCSNSIRIANATTCNSDDTNSGTTTGIYSQVSPAIANFDSDNNIEIIINGRTTCSSANANSKIKAYDSKTNNPEWEYSIQAIRTAPNIADIDGDGNYNIIMASNTTKILILNNDGTLNQNYSLIGQVGSSPVIGDIDSDGKAELTVKRAGSPLSIFSSITGNNTQPLIGPLDNITARETETINVNGSGQLKAFDIDNNILSYDYSAPFDESGLWSTNVNDTGNYSILVGVNDGNLSDSQFIEVKVFPKNSTRINTFSTGNSSASLLYSQPQNKSVQVRIPKNATILYSRIKIGGSS